MLLRNGENEKALDLLGQNYGPLARNAMEKVMKYSNLSQDEMVRVFGKISDILENVADKISRHERLNEKKEKAADFAEYVTLTMSGELHGLGGHYSVKLSEDADEKEQIAYQAYENAIPVPDSQDAKEFWVTLKETISQYF